MKTMKFSAKFGAFILCVSMVLSLCTVFAFGAEEDGVAPVQTSSVEADLTIKTADDLLSFAGAVNGGNSYAGQVIALGDNIDLTNVEWTPIGTASNPFSGTFDGAGYTVSNLIYQGAAQIYGFFGVIAGATVQNLRVTGSIESTYASNNIALGGIVAQANSRTDENSLTTNSTISNCENYVTIKYWQSVDGNNIFAAGIVAWAYAGTTVQNCTNNASISAGNNKDKRGASAGGIVANAEGIDGSPVTVLNCENLAEVSVLSKLTDGGWTNAQIPCSVAGGIAGRILFAKVENSLNKGNVVCDSGSTYKAVCGGIVGFVRYGSSVDTCTNEGAVEASQAAGGIAGATDSYNISAGKNFPASIKSCINNGSVTATGRFLHKNGTDADAYAGGICGYFRAQNSSDTKAYIDQCINTATVTGKGVVSGIVCVLSARVTFSVKNCINAGDVVGIYNATVAGIYVSGAINVKSAYAGDFQYCMNIGRVILRDERADKSVAAKLAYVGAFAAQNVNSKIKNTYCLANIIIDDTIQPISQADGTTLEICKNVSITNTTNKVLSETDNAVEKFNTLLGTAYPHWYQGIEAPMFDYNAYLAEAKVRGASVGLADALSLSFFVLNKGAMLNEDLTVSCTDANGEAVTLKETLDGEYLCYTVADITPADMDTVYNVVISTDDAVASTLSYSMIDYAAKQYVNSEDEDLKALLEAMMYYGDAAQANKGDAATVLSTFAAKAGYEINASYVADNYGTLDLHKIVNEGEDLTLADKAVVALYLENNIRPSFQIDGAASMTVDFNKTFNNECKEENGYFIVDCLFAPSLEDGFRIKAYDENGKLIGQMKYSIATYILGLLDEESSATDVQKTLAMATAVYMNQAKTYKQTH